MSMMKIKKGDTVKVIAGKDKDKEGKVISVDHKDGKVTVEGINMITKHEKPSAANANGGIVQKEAAIDISNVMYVHKGTATRVGFRMENDKKVRFAKCNNEYSTMTAILTYSLQVSPILFNKLSVKSFRIYRASSNLSSKV